MLKINRLIIKINTINGIYGIDEIIQDGLNFVASHENTCGKSSILAAIYYCLGFEQILGGTGGIGSKVLTSALKNTIDDNGKSINITQSGAYLEISNGIEVVTIYRNIKAENKDNRLITVYYGAYDTIVEHNTQSDDFYVHIINSATRAKGFHTFLENFLHLELPIVRTSDGNERKLYLQVIFSSMFIEQKHGWSDILSGMPILGIRESKKRVVEFILGLDTLKNEKEKERLNIVKIQLENEWMRLISEIRTIIYSETCNILNLPLRPCVINDNDLSRISIITSDERYIPDEITRLQIDHDGLRQLKPRVLDNFDELHIELSETETNILTVENDLTSIIKRYTIINDVISRLIADLDIINCDIRNNEDASRLQQFGAEASKNELSVNICPTCKQNIQDNLLNTNMDSSFMSIDDNIRHLKEQKKMIEFSLNSRRNTQNDLERKKKRLETNLQTLRRLAQTLRSDLNTTIDTEASEAIMLKKVEISSRIERLKKLSDTVAIMINKLKELSSRWNEYLDQKEKLPASAISDSDNEKIRLLEKYFIDNLKRFNYSSLSNIDGIKISDDTLLPIIDGFDMKFDSSASDNIRVIWAFTMALLQISNKKNGNHPCIVIFDEPAQQSIVPEDMKSFINFVSDFGKNCQIITAITLNSNELTNIIDKLNKKLYHKINIIGKAFKLLN